MCDVCKSEQINTCSLNGDKDSLASVCLYKVYSSKIAKISVCRFHEIELFKKGERWFLRSNLSFAHMLAENSD